jgi:hypothetical protein
MLAGGQLTLGEISYETVGALGWIASKLGRLY